MKRSLARLLCALLACLTLASPCAAADEDESAHSLWEYIGMWSVMDEEYASVELIYDMDEGFSLYAFFPGMGDFFADWTGDDEYADPQRFLDEYNNVTFILESLGGAFMLSAEGDGAVAEKFGGSVYVCVPMEEDEGEFWGPSVFLNLDGTCIVGAAPFEGGIGWVQYVEGSELVTAAVRTDGGQLFSITGPVWYVSPFENGAAYAVISDNALHYDYGVYTSCYAQSSPVTVHEVIYDAYGKECYVTSASKDSRTDSEEHIICSGEGKFVVLRRESGLEGIVCKLGTIDMYGNVIDPFKTYDGVSDGTLSSWKSLFSGARNLPFKYGAGYGTGNYCDGDPGDGYPRYIGGGAYYLTGGKVYLPSENLFVQLKGAELLSDNIGGKVLSYTNGTYYIQSVRGGDYEYASLFRSESSRDIDRLRAKFCYWHWNRYMPNNLFYYDHGYYNINMERVIDIEPYSKLKMDGSVFNEGYALILLEGADGNTYVTVINEQGQVMFEPFRAKRTSSQVSDGYFVAQTDTDCAVYDVNGYFVRRLCPADEAGYFRIISGGHVIIYGASGNHAFSRIFALNH